MFMKATSVFLVLVSSAFVNAYVTPLRVQEDAQAVLFDDVKVPVVLGVQSRDRGALVCQSVFDQVLKKVANKVDLSLAYVAQIDNSDQDFGVYCENGFEECAANVQQLCVKKYYEHNQWWRFVMCQNYQGRDKIGNPEVARSCARAAQIDWEGSGVGECMGPDARGTGAEGVELLQQNVKATREAEINTSCTVVINNTPVCVHDGVWKECEDGHSANDFIRQINDEWRKINSFTLVGDDL